ncbi:MAG: tRNA pseudouridine(55) synthase TruB, partial [Megasphaera elsdenii]|nr:tRNA pseudouridine(55) synthase TruB [Megasphaera elsdenii]
MIHGIINVLKPTGMSSHDVIGCLRRIYGMKKMGHAGTLDPLAAGVLPVYAGQATRL